MRLITWNCQGAFRKKADFILKLCPDILVVQECEHTDKLKFPPMTPKPNDFYWYGDVGKKGIGLFSYSEYKFELLSVFNPEFRYVIPFRVKGNGHSFTFFVIWAMNNKENRDARFIGQVWFAINQYNDLLGNSTILIGDFNSNSIWDYKDRVATHSDVVSKLAEKDIHSVYHKHFDIGQGQEKHPTFYMYRKKEKPYHIDYCFVSADLLGKVKEVKIGDYDTWSAQSDHVPLNIKFDI